MFVTGAQLQVNIGEYVAEGMLQLPELHAGYPTG